MTDIEKASVIIGGPHPSKADFREKGAPGLLVQTPLGTALVLRPLRTDNQYENCESVERLIALGIPERDALEEMAVSREAYLYFKYDAVHMQNADLEKDLREYRKRAQTDAETIARLEGRLEALTAILQKDDKDADADNVDEVQ